jgi:hypothetical protein
MTSRNKNSRSLMAVARVVVKGAVPLDVGRQAVSARATKPKARGALVQAAAPAKVVRRRGPAAPRSDQTRIAELKQKLGDEDYMNGAILRIATVLSARLTLR